MGLLDILFEDESERAKQYERQASLMDDPYMRAQQMATPDPDAGSQEVDHKTVQRILGQAKVGDPQVQAQQAAQNPEAFQKGVEIGNRIKQQPQTYADVAGPRETNDDGLLTRLFMNRMAPKTYGQQQTARQGRNAAYDKGQENWRANQAYGQVLDNPTGDSDVNAKILAQKNAMAKEQFKVDNRAPKDDKTSSIKEYNFYRQQGGKLPFYEYKKSLAKAGATNLGLGDASVTDGVARSKVGTGVERYKSRLNETKERPTQGSKDYTVASGNYREIGRQMKSIDKMVDAIKKDDTGVESVGKKSKQLAVMYENMVANIAVLFDKGVLQGNEREELESALVNPSNFSAHFETGGVDGIIAGYEQYKDILNDKLKVAGSQFDDWDRPRPGEKQSVFNRRQRLKELRAKKDAMENK